MTSSNENIFRVTGPLWGEFTGHRWIPLTKASDAELWLLLFAPEQNKNNEKRLIAHAIISERVKLVQAADTED